MESQSLMHKKSLANTITVTLKITFLAVGFILILDSEHLCLHWTLNIVQLYWLSLQNPSSFGIVLSPKGEGLKALCVHLTQPGIAQVAEYFREAATAQASGIASDATLYVCSRIHDSGKKFYCQIPIGISDDSCEVVDLRSELEVSSQLRHFIFSNQADNDWIWHDLLSI